MRTRFFLLNLIFCLLSAAAASAADKRIVVGVHEHPPLIFTDADDQVKGLVADILTHIARQAHWDIQYLAGSRAKSIQRLEDGTIDLLAGMAASSQLEGMCTFGKETIVADWGQVYVSSKASLSDILDFNDKDIAVVAADTYFQYFERVLDQFEIRPRYIRLEGYEAVLSLIHTNKVSAGIVSRLYGAYRQKRFNLNISPIRFKPTQLRFAVARGSNASVIATLDRHLKLLQENPDSIFYQSLERWTSGERKTNLPVWLNPLWVVGVIATIMGLIIAGNLLLRRQVKQRTEALQSTIAEKEKIESELAVAREIQLQLVPGNLAGPVGKKAFDIYASLEPAQDVGGDFYDYFFIDRNSICLVIGDVSGKGVPAALFMAMTKTMIKSAARLLVEPEYILADVNREIAGNNPSLTFVTVFLAVLNLNSGNLTYTCAGHNPPLIIGRNGNVILLGDAQCPAIGLDDAHQYRQASVNLRHREGLLLFTDGVIEARDEKHRLFSQEALMETVSRSADRSPEEQVVAIWSQIREFTKNHPPDDDMTLLAVTYFSPDRISEPLKSVVLKNDIREMNRIVDTITRVADSVACPQVVVQDITLAMEEVFSNIVFYGFGDDLDHDITFHLASEGDALILTLQDEGIPFNPLNVQMDHGNKPLEAWDKGGMGIVLAKNLMDRMEYRRERGKNVLRMEKRYR